MKKLLFLLLSLPLLLGSCQILTETGAVAGGVGAGLLLSGGNPVAGMAGGVGGLFLGRYIVVQYIAPPNNEVAPDNWFANTMFQIRKLFEGTINGLVIIILAIFALPLLLKSGRETFGVMTRKVAGNSASKKELDSVVDRLNNIETHMKGK